MFRFTRKPSSASHNLYLAKITHFVQSGYVELVQDVINIMAANYDLWRVCAVHCVRVYCEACVPCTVWGYTVRRVCCALCEGILWGVCIVHCVRVYCEACVLCTVWGYTVRRVCCALCEGILWGVCAVHYVRLYCEVCVLCTMWGYTSSF